jgi:hypothetical protein
MVTIFEVLKYNLWLLLCEIKTSEAFPTLLQAISLVMTHDSEVTSGRAFKTVRFWAGATRDRPLLWLD